VQAFGLNPNQWGEKQAPENKLKHNAFWFEFSQATKGSDELNADHP
jgi:hypothetical protein